MTTGDALFEAIEAQHAASMTWGSVLDAGTGKHSLRWLLQASQRINITRIVAVTGDVEMAKQLQLEFQHALRPQDKIIVGNWTDESLLEEEQAAFDIILSDYLIGAIDGFAPYFQDQILARIARHLKPMGRLHIVGMEPFPENNGHSRRKCPTVQLIHEMANVRDACIRLANHRCYREYPKEWVIRQVRALGASYEIRFEKSYPIRYTPYVIQRQLQVARSKLAFIASPSVAAAMSTYISDLEKRSKNMSAVSYGSDYLISLVAYAA